MNNGWSIAKLGDYISIKSGLSYKGSKIGYGDSILLGMGCVSYKDTFVYSGARPYDGNDIDEAYCVNVGDIVLATRQQSDNLPILAMPAIIPDDFYGKKVIFGTNLYKVDNNSELSNRFIFWLLKNKHYVAYIAGVKSGTAVQMVTKKNVENYKFLCPPKKQREAIADLMWTYEKIISNNNKCIKILEQMAENLYKEWFVRFRFPGHENVEFEIGIPKGWEYTKLGDIADFAYGKMPNQEHILEDSNGYPIFSGYRVNGYYDSYMYEDEKLVLIARGVGGTGDVAISPPKSYITNLSIVFNLKNEALLRDYLYQRFRIQNLRYLDTGAAQSQITIENLKRVKVIMPSEKTLCHYNEIINTISCEMSTIERKNDILIKQRDLLLPRLMSGKLQVK